MRSVEVVLPARVTLIYLWLFDAFANASPLKNRPYTVYKSVKVQASATTQRLAYIGKNPRQIEFCRHPV